MSIFSGSFAIALVYVMYSYSGWNAAAYITGEIKRPEKNVPRSLLAGTSIVIVIYVLLNAIFLATTPTEELKGQLEVALVAGKHIFGSTGGAVAGAVICLGLISSISSMTWIGPRVTMSMGEDHWLLRLLGRKNQHGIPTNAIILQLLDREFTFADAKLRDVVRYTQFSLLICSLLAVLGVVVLRFDASRIHTAVSSLGLSAPAASVFAAITIWMMFYLLRWHTRRVPGRAGDDACRFAPLLLRGKTPRLAPHEEKLFRKKRFTRLCCSILVSALALYAQENPELAPRALPVCGPNDIARFLAGMPVPPDSPLAPLTRNPAWQAHSAYFEREFSKLICASSKNCTLGRTFIFRTRHNPFRSRFICSAVPTSFTWINFFREPRSMFFAGKNRWDRRPILCASQISPARSGTWRTR